MMETIAALMLAAPAGACAPLPANTRLPLTIGRLTISASAPTITQRNGAIAFNKITIMVQQPTTTLGLEVRLATGSVGDVKVVELDPGGATIRQATLVTRTPGPPSVITHQVVTQRARDVRFMSLNNEGEMLAICEIR